ncbi:MAG: four helix bundle protein [Candidatus Marinimicrobia bacterium]|nr:four helix bundle protein [Candidatus Neomarinimicrobiota bacterium]
MNFDEWLITIPIEITNDPLWNMKVYRLSLFVSDLGWFDVSKLVKDKRTLKLSDQLYRSLGSISANIVEGYSRSSGRDQARFYEYALGSARESRDWYYKGRHIQGTETANHRISLLSQIIRLLLTIIPRQRNYQVSDPYKEYNTNIEKLLENVPIP